MQRHPSVQTIKQLLRELNLLHAGQRMLVIGATPAANDDDTICIDGVNCVADIPNATRVHIAVVVGQLEQVSKVKTTHLLSRLRDLISERVLLILFDNAWSADELLALGYLPITRQKKRSSDDERLYLFDPDQFNEPRAWNNDTNWANPENFKKFRW